MNQVNSVSLTNGETQPHTTPQLKGDRSLVWLFPQQHRSSLHDYYIDNNSMDTEEALNQTHLTTRDKQLDRRNKITNFTSWQTCLTHDLSTVREINPTLNHNKLRQTTGDTADENEWSDRHQPMLPPANSSSSNDESKKAMYQQSAIANSGSFENPSDILSYTLDILSDTISEIFAAASKTGLIKSSQYNQLTTALNYCALDKQHCAAIKRILHSVKKGYIQLVDDLPSSSNHLD